MEENLDFFSLPANLASRKVCPDVAFEGYMQWPLDIRGNVNWKMVFSLSTDRCRLPTDFFFEKLRRDFP